MSETKPTVDIENAYINADGQLFGHALNHPRLGDCFVRTSSIQGIDGDKVETRNTIYNVLSWAKKPEAFVNKNEPEATP